MKLFKGYYNMIYQMNKKPIKEGFTCYEKYNASTRFIFYFIPDGLC